MMPERLDQELLQELELLMEEDFSSLLAAYLRDSEQRFFELTEAWEAGDFDGLSRNAHSLKGSSSNIGAAVLAALCGDLEGLARDRCAEQVPAALDRVRGELGEVRQAVQALHDAC
jgi:histidine phosphotransfer protein HptB